MLFAAGLIVWVLAAGPVTLSGHPWVFLVLGVLAGAISLVITHGHVVRRRRPVGVAAGSPGELAVQPRDELAVVPVDGRTGAAVAFGAAGLFLFSVFFGVLAFALGLTALRRGTPGRWGRTAATAAVLLGIADFIILITMVATQPHHGVLRWS
ncbi:hypothetical protein ACWT_5375 [Actinoplanes sp. SE50]|uniref:hypothetical protein n=1 Tax=unclassified Actinoplanes TaxID=2626549 RepID=UPI00023EC32F|nr:MULTISPECIES: hypothetical protein [unclassified Actinoplanes]AEV86393.1 hypothetical protein ACPL_5506 [Actinoplanes sp. SE50/110]ATO84790.1 hypothetical protein ACWT_5375 [Actinoplanes sp. SE50]SLM02200.1 hypothetical protein ACSP50_5438 [Actinoplanes sp. SE50/110]